MSYLEYVIGAYAVFAVVLGWDFLAPRLQVRRELRAARLRVARDGDALQFELEGASLQGKVSVPLQDLQTRGIDATFELILCRYQQSLQRREVQPAVRRRGSRSRRTKACWGKA